MKKIIITIMALVMMLGITSCGEKREVSKTVTFGSTEVFVSEKTYDDDKIVDRTDYVITYATPEEAWNAVHGK